MTHKVQIYNQKRKMRSFLYVLIPISITCTSCEYSRNTHLSCDDLTWLEVYEEGDTMWFCSPKNETDTLVITKIRSYDSDSCVDLKDYSSQLMAHGVIEYRMIHKGKTFDGTLLQIRKEREDELIKVRISLCGICSEELEPVLTGRYVNGVKVDDCIVVDNTNSETETNLDDLSITRIIWSKSQGLIGYYTTTASYFLRKSPTSPSPNPRDHYMHDYLYEDLRIPR